MSKEHTYQLTIAWTGNLGSGTSGYRAYERAHEITAPEKPSAIPGSSDPAFRGDPRRYSPEELFVASLSSCHMLWYLHLCSDQGVVVTAYRDQAQGTMVEHSDGSGEVTRVTLRPHVTLASAEKVRLARELHGKAHTQCFIARSVRCDVAIEPTFDVVGEG